MILQTKYRRVTAIWAEDQFTSVHEFQKQCGSIRKMLLGLNNTNCVLSYTSVGDQLQIVPKLLLDVYCHPSPPDFSGGS